ncbi:MAG TPA: formate dehydrogenase subunit gamma [bacterium]
MKTHSRSLAGRTLAGGLLLLALAGLLTGWPAGAKEDLSNPHANLWRAVRQGIAGFMTAPAEGHRVLIQNSGENWRELRNGVLIRLSPWVLAAALAGAGLFYAVVGKDKLERPRSGVLLERYTKGERALHWYTATLFVVMALTGLSLLLGRVALIPVLGHRAVAAYLLGAKAVHNYCGPLLLVGIVLEFLRWVRFNIPTRMDVEWLKTLGGMFGRGPRPHAGKINGGEKGWFWLVAICGAAVGVTGVLLDFPVWGQTRFVMQFAHVVHVAFAVIFVTASFGHIYMGTLGAEGTFEGMWRGTVDSVWAKQHQDLWYEEQVRARGIPAEDP